MHLRRVRVLIADVLLNRAFNVPDKQTCMHIIQVYDEVSGHLRLRKLPVQSQPFRSSVGVSKVTTGLSS